MLSLQVLLTLILVNTLLTQAPFVISEDMLWYSEDVLIPYLYCIHEKELQSSFFPSEHNLTLVLRDSYCSHTVLIQIEILFECHIAVARYQFKGLSDDILFDFFKWATLVMLHVRSM